MKFEKWQALGNDYIVIEADEIPWALTRDRIEAICKRHFGVGSDGILVLDRSEDDDYVAELQIFNPDGTEAELSGNGAREAVLYLRRAGWTDRETFTILTRAGDITPTITSPERAVIEMGQASLSSENFPSGGEDGRGSLEAGGRSWDFQHVAIGNPQCAIEVSEDEIEELDIASFGAEIEHHELFPNRTNVSFFHADGPIVRARIFERGVGETLSSGTGASGAAVAAYLGGAESPITVVLDGGELAVEVSEKLDIRLTGTAHPIYSGEFTYEFLKSLE